MDKKKGTLILFFCTQTQLLKKQPMPAKLKKNIKRIDACCGVGLK